MNADRETRQVETAPNRDHALTIDDGWREVVATALGFVQRCVR
jgi:hypothetical protein